MSSNSRWDRSWSSRRRRVRWRVSRATTRCCSGARSASSMAITPCRWQIPSIRSGSLSMISYLVDAVLLIALAFTSMRVTRMHRELARLRSYQGEFSTIVHETAGAFDNVVTAAHDSTANLGRLANVLSAKIDQAHEAIAALDARTGMASAATAN